MAGADPETAVPIFIQSQYRILSQAVRIPTIVPVGLETVTVIPVQTIAGSEPQEPVIVLDDGGDPTLEPLPIYRQPDEADVLFVDDRRFY